MLKGGEIMKNIRILPMSKKEETFKEMPIEKVQEMFFKDILVNECGNKYYFSGLSGIEVKYEDIILFQYDNHVIASAIVIDYDKKNRCMVLRDNTINTFKPIDKEELKQFIPSFKKFCQMKLKYPTDTIEYDSLLKRIGY